jgi:hypothetical protein
MGPMLFTIVSGIKSRIRRTVDVFVRKAVLIAAAVVVLLLALMFGLIAAYHALIEAAGFTPIESAGLVALSLAGVGLLVLAVLPLVAKSNRTERELVPSAGEGLAMIDTGLSKATEQVGALPVLAIAFAVGFLASRR